jgi:magnesium transporter
MSEASAVAEVVADQLEALLKATNYDGAKLLLQPVQPVDAAEAIGSLPRTLQALAFRLLPKDEAIEVYEYLEPHRAAEPVGAAALRRGVGAGGGDVPR